MKIEIDLKDILHDEHGDPMESLSDSIRRQVIDRLVGDAQEAVQAEAKTAVDKVIADTVKAALTERVPELIQQLLDTEYMPVGRYGDRSEPTTVRNELVKHLTETAVYKRSQYSSDKNPWSAAVDEAVSKTLQGFQSAWTKQVDNAFMAQAMNYASEQFAKRAGIALKAAQAA